MDEIKKVCDKNNMIANPPHHFDVWSVTVGFEGECLMQYWVGEYCYVHALHHSPYHALYHSPNHALYHSPYHALYHSLYHALYHSPNHALYHSLYHALYHSPYHALHHFPYHALYTLPTMFFTTPLATHSTSMT
ncbi:hypothetical protein Pmani_021009 [Petrolisthes manimaculis]|uniref:Uncharacterized protein n=1 Tax=Petrolisthes manimaculis TaxID=1843537 RepID=A0AAE1PH56_9EUCA|nr:hypothetical protein Pmani_021009 [Petrolisthes manimaculis]